MDSLIKELRSLTGLTFTPADDFYWSPSNSTVFYKKSTTGDSTETDTWSLLHEVAHGVLEHTTYKTDFELVKLESEAWHKAKQLAKKFDIKIDQNHIEDCLNSYRDWLFTRSTCPTCSMNGLMISPSKYSCPNCNSNWQVSRSRFCRPYRMGIKSPTNTQ